MGYKYIYIKNTGCSCSIVAISITFTVLSRFRCACTVTGGRLTDLDFYIYINIKSGWVIKNRLFYSHSKWVFYKTTWFDKCVWYVKMHLTSEISSLQMSFPGHLHLVLVLRPKTHPQTTGTDLGFRFSQDDFALKMPVRDKTLLQKDQIALLYTIVVNLYLANKTSGAWYSINTSH